MSERPILFSGPMVHAILEGRKTQTRRVVKPQPVQAYTVARVALSPPLSDGTFEELWWNGIGSHDGQVPSCPYGVPGDRLWVRETWRESHGGGGQIHYAASVSEYERNEKGPWKPSIHMPRWASRLTLEVKAVRVERLQEISENDCEAEGIERLTGNGPNFASYLVPGLGHFNFPTMVGAYRELWDGINAKRGHSWETNPWVWVVEFERAEEAR